MLTAEDLNNIGCDKIDALCVDAYFDLKLDEEDPTKLIFDNSWGTWNLDLTPAIKAGETVTSLEITDKDGVPTYLQFNREDGGEDCIHGDDLSRIISMRYLKDVDQTTAPTNGDVYMFRDGKFYTFNLQNFVNNTNSRLTGLENRMTSVENQIAQMAQQIAYILNVIAKPGGIPDDARIAWGNRNVYGDYTNSSSHSHGIFTHDTSNDLSDDLYFS